MENQKELFTIDDYLNEVNKIDIIDPTKKYDPLHFWDGFGDLYRKSLKRPQDIRKHSEWVIFKLLKLKVDTILDAGCGFCRLEPFLLDSGAAKEITAIDISQKQLDSSNEYLKDYPKLDKIIRKKLSIKNSKLPSDSFDCALSVECLSHMHLPTVRYALHEMKRIAKKYVVLVERYVFTEEHPQPHIWSHDYVKLCGDMGLKVLEAKMINNGVVGVILKK
jgi:SAM-dependent methyltransferase